MLIALFFVIFLAGMLAGYFAGRAYYSRATDGVIHADKDDSRLILQVEFLTDPDELAKRDRAYFDISRE